MLFFVTTYYRNNIDGRQHSATPLARVGNACLACNVFINFFITLLTPRKQAFPDKLQIPDLVLHNRHIAPSLLVLPSKFHYRQRTRNGSRDDGRLSQAVRYCICSLLSVCNYLQSVDLLMLSPTLPPATQKRVKAKTCSTCP